MRSFDTLAARSVLVSLIGITLVHLISLWTYERALERELRIANQTQLASRLLSIAQTIMSAPGDGREAVAHELSGGPITVHWSPDKLVMGGGGEASQWNALIQEIRALTPDLRAEDIVVGTNTAADPHLTTVALRMRDNSWVNFTIFESGRPHSSGHGSLLSTSLMALGVVLLSLFIARWLTRPIRLVAQAAAALSPEKHAGDVPVIGPREVRDLATAFNAMQQRITELVRRRTQALAAVSHDLRTPLTRLELRVEEVADQSLKSAMIRDIQEMEQIIDATLSYMRGETRSEPTRALDLVALMRTIVDDARDRGRVAELHAPDRLVIRGRSVALRRAFANLVDNALKFGERLSVRITRVKGCAEISVADNGPGIPDNQLDAVLDPFVRLESSRNRDTGGVGLGLTIAKSAIEADGGSLSLANGARGGLIVTARLPLALNHGRDPIQKPQ